MGFGGLKLTNFGLNVLTKAQAGKPLELTRVGVGDGVLGSGSLISKTALIAEKMSLPIDAIRQKENTASVIALLSNGELAQEFYFRELGIYARDPDSKLEGLYVYDNCLEQGELIGDKNSPYRVNFYMRLNLGISSATQIVFTPSGNPIYVLYEDFDAHCRDFSQHVGDEECHIKPTERARWNGMAAGNHNHDAAYAPLSHATDVVKHITATERTDWNNRVKKSTSVAATLTAAGWVGTVAPFTQTLSVAAVTATSANEVLRPLALTEVIRDAWDAASFADGGQSAGKLTVTAWGEKPTINLPCRIIVRGDL